MKNVAIYGLLSLCMTGCAAVQLNAGGQEVQIGYAGKVQDCETLGVVEVMTQSVVDRGTATVQEDLYTLARNNAATMGATNLVPHALPKDGSQSFSALRCDQKKRSLASR